MKMEGFFDRKGMVYEGVNDLQIITAIFII